MSIQSYSQDSLSKDAQEDLVELLESNDGEAEFIELREEFVSETDYSGIQYRSIVDNLNSNGVLNRRVENLHEDAETEVYLSLNSEDY